MDEARRFRDTLGHFASGVTIVTGISGGVPVGFTCQSFYSLSLEPPMVSFSVARTSTTYPLLRDAGRFTVNVLAEHQHAIARQFAISGSDKWAGIRWLPSAAGNPLLDGVLMWVDATLTWEKEAGDHTIAAAEVTGFGIREDAPWKPLLFFRGAFHRVRDE